MAEKKTFVLRLQPELFQALEKWAIDEYRSVNAQLEWLLHNSLKQQGRIVTGNSGGESSGETTHKHPKKNQNPSNSTDPI